jgi:hypothetical protein
MSETSTQQQFTSQLFAEVERSRLRFLRAALAPYVAKRALHPGAIQAAEREILSRVEAILIADRRYQLALDDLYWKRELRALLAMIARRERPLIGHIAPVVACEQFGPVSWMDYLRKTIRAIWPNATEEV